MVRGKGLEPIHLAVLDPKTRRRIDTARDILVGKVPDPKSQVEQITIAMIYKFMNDMDAESEELGGERKFFAGDFARYSWAKLVNSGLGGHETLNLYAEAVSKMPENPGIPLLFRDIFKNAFLPYRDPETPRAFLKVIDEFSYDHSERLGDAFEYLLSILSSQGDAGQFRTPRHIIEFIVQMVNPKKNEVVLDPACGTAGFLISAYKHILAANTGPDGYITLTPEERGRLAQNFRGYDISPDMVRLSLVNMYLHGFSDPHIYEYDTLTSEDRWNEYADVVLANPPFMSPKGGIRPHNRFTVKSKRSEALFLSYMMEHLTPTGRAGIIVPEGIIFQSQNAYKQLRATLVNDFLVAVVSLPAGVFQPYSGVKTSILILDKVMAKRSSSILFLQVSDDGYDLGATRRYTGEGDLPDALKMFKNWKELNNSAGEANFTETPISLVVPRQQILDSPDCRLTADSYRKRERANHGTYPWMPLGELLGTRVNNRAGEEQSLPVLSITMKHGLVDQAEKFRKRIASPDITNYKKVDRDQLVVGFPIDEGVLGIQSLYPCAAVSPAYNVWTIKAKDKVDLKFFELLLRSDQARAEYRLRMRGTASRRRSISEDEFLRIEFPLPPLDIQTEVVAEVEGYQKVIDGSRAVVENYRPSFNPEPEWPTVELGEICSLGGTITSNIDPAKPYFGSDSIESNTGRLIKNHTAGNQNVQGPVYEFSGKRLLYSKIRPYLNKLTVVDMHGYCSSDMYPLIPDHDRVDYDFLAAFMLSAAFSRSIEGYYQRARIPKINRAQLFSVNVPLPPLATQKRIVADLNVEKELVEANIKLITRLEAKIEDVLARVWRT